MIAPTVAAAMLAAAVQAATAPPATRAHYRQPPPALPTCAFVMPPAAMAQSLGEVPAAVRAELDRLFASRGRLADAGQVFEATDNITDPALPRQRFARGYRFGERWIFWVEVGGLGYHIDALALLPYRTPGNAGVHYVIDRGAGFSGNLCRATQAILDRLPPVDRP